MKVNFPQSFFCLYSCTLLSGVGWFKMPAKAGRLYLMDRQLNPGCLLRSWFKSLQGRHVESLFQDPISYGRFTGATLNVPCLNLGLINFNPILLAVSFKKNFYMFGSIQSFILFSMFWQRQAWQPPSSVSLRGSRLANSPAHGLWVYHGNCCPGSRNPAAT